MASLTTNVIDRVRRTRAGTACRAAALGVAAAYRVYHPKRLPIRRGPAEAGIPAETVRIPVRGSRVSLHAWYLPAGSASRSIVIGHGIGRHKGFSWPYAEFLHRAGFNVLAFDHRNHGESDFDPAFWAMARRFTDDMQAAVAWLHARHASPVSILTFSFSTFPALHALRRTGGAVDAIVCDSGPCLNIESLCQQFLVAGKAYLPEWLARPAGFELFSTVYTRAVTSMLGVDHWPPDLRDATTRLLFIANEHDAIVPAGDVARFAALYRGSDVWEVRGASHLAAFKTDPQAYARVVLDFLTRGSSGQPAEPC